MRRHRILIGFAAGFTAAAAFFAERLIVYAAAGAAFIPPLALLTVLAWFPALSLPQRLLLGGILGIALDSISALPLAFYTLLFLLLAGLTEFLLSIISHSDSLAAKSAVFAALAAPAILLVILIRPIL